MNKKLYFLIPLVLIAIGCGTAPDDKEEYTNEKPPVATVAPSKSTAAKKTVPTINGDDVVHIGEDVPAGVYRAVHAVDGDDMCYWNKSKDAEGSDIIDNDIVSGGRPQVTLKKGQWFTSQGCPDWQKKE